MCGGGDGRLDSFSAKEESRVASGPPEEALLEEIAHRPGVVQWEDRHGKGQARVADHSDEAGVENLAVPGGAQ